MEENIELAQSGPNWGAIGSTAGALTLGGALAHLLAKNIIADKEKTKEWKKRKASKKREKKNYGSDLVGYIAYEALDDLLEFDSKFKLGGAIGDYLKTVTGQSLRSANKRHERTKVITNKALEKRKDAVAQAKASASTAQRDKKAAAYSLKGQKYMDGGEVGKPPPTNNILKDLWRELTHRSGWQHRAAKRHAMEPYDKKVSDAYLKLDKKKARLVDGYGQKSRILDSTRKRRDRQKSAFNRALLGTGAVAATGAGGYAYAKHKQKQKRRNSYYR